MALLHTTPSPAAELQLNPVELARIDHIAVDGYPGGVFPQRLVRDTIEKTDRILQVEIARVGEPPEIPDWVHGYQARDFRPRPTRDAETLDEHGWVAAILASANGEVVGEDTLAAMARILHEEMRDNLDLRRNRPQLTTNEARVVRVALGWRALTATDSIVGLEANVARRRYANVPYGPVDFLANAGQNATRTFRRLASLAF